MDYGKIISFGFSRAWKHPTLWILGLFAAGGGGGGFNIPSRMGRGDWGDCSRWGGFDFPYQLERIVTNPAFLLTLIAFALAAFLIFVILNIISIGGLVDAAGRFRRGEEYSFTGVFKTG